MNLTNAIEQAISNVYAGKLLAGDLDAGTWRANVEALWQAVANAAGTPAEGEALFDLVSALRQSAMVFAAFKNHHNISDLVEALTDSNGQPRSFAAFRDIALAIQQDYNGSWLEAEYNTAIATGQMAVRWQDFQDNREELPYLRYVTAGDERVRLAHQLLQGTVRHIDDAFWDEWLPPVGWNCRCDVEQVAGGETDLPEYLPDEKQAPLVFRFNAGKTRQLFGPEHPYFAGFKEQERDRIMKAMQGLAEKERLQP